MPGLPLNPLEFLAPRSAGLWLALLLCACHSPPGSSHAKDPNSTASRRSSPDDTSWELTADAGLDALYPAASGCLRSFAADAGTSLPRGVASASAFGDTDYGIVTRPPLEEGPVPRKGKIACGRVECEIGKEICCKGRDVCVRLSPAQVKDPSKLVGLCDSMKSRLLACDDSASCGEGHACCESTTESGEKGPAFCMPARSGERFACDGIERCLPEGPCLTEGARCVEGHCVVAKPRHRVECPKRGCPKASDVCCEFEGTRLTCLSERACLARQGLAFRCTSPRDCAKGEACAVSPVESHCTHAFGEGPSYLCEKEEDCPIAIREACAREERRLVCEPATAMDALMVGRSRCGCAEPTSQGAP